MTDYIICAAGAGTRMREIHPKIPKPLLILKNRSLLDWSVASLDLYPEDQLIIILPPHVSIPDWEEKFQLTHPRVTLKILNARELTRGQLETALYAKSLLRENTPVVIFNSDTYFRTAKLHSSAITDQCDGWIPCSAEAGENWSFCAVQDSPSDSSGIKAVTRVTEKERISEWCSVGYYGFKSKEYFIELAELSIAQTDGSKELYVAPIYQAALARGDRIKMVPVDLFMPMGSMEQLASYWETSLADMRKENPRGTLVVDLDNTLTIENAGFPYSKKEPNLEVIQKLRQLYEVGYRIVIHTARRMKTHRADEAMVIADIGMETLIWLRDHEVPFDGLRFGKPYAEYGFYLDDRAIRPQEFLQLEVEELMRLIQN